MYEIISTKLFDKRLANLKETFHLKDDQVEEAIENIKFSIQLLKQDKLLPEEYYDHVLEDDPWIGFNEYYVLDDLLVVYYKIDKKKRIRLTSITTHSELRNGKLD